MLLQRSIGCRFGPCPQLFRLFIFFIFWAFSPVVSPAQNRYDILISEFLPDPSPSVGMPESSFIELYNRSGHDFSLLNWKISNGNTTATIKTDYQLEADSFLILCPTSSVTAYSSWGPALGISGFPSLNNDAGDIILSSGAGSIIHAVHYSKNWFENGIKASGGWSLEMIDPANPCSEKENWAASISPSGGTPGKKNSVYAENPDAESPSLVRAIAIDSLKLVLIFDEALDSASATDVSNYFLSDDIGSPEKATASAPFFDHVSISLKTPLNTGKIYTVSVQGVRDCHGNEISLQNNCKAGIPGRTQPGDVIINEVLFNPPPYGSDYIELFNRGTSVIAGSSLFIAGIDPNGNLKDPEGLVTEEHLLFPGEYFLLTEDPVWVMHNYPLAPAPQILSLPVLPSMPDDRGKIALLNASGVRIDELDYDHHWHSPLLTSESGISLERINPNLPASMASNWTSAAASAGFGTPGYKNSESFSAGNSDSDLISVEPKIFSPDQDGYQDFLFIHYQLPAAGFMGSISIYDILGRVVRKLVNNILWGTSGSFRWDGLDESMNRLPTGHYILYIELFLPDGTVKKQKLVCVLAGNS